VATRIHEAGSPYTGVYLYMLDDGMLKLEAHAGAPTPHTEIPVHHGLCGRAVRESRDLNVADVGAEPEYLACSVTTRSELICLVRAGDKVVGQIDVDSDVPAGFPAEEEAAVRAVADVLGGLL
jgi:GAF domain-containing protein